VARGCFIEDSIPGEVIFTSKIPYTPSNSVFFVTYKDSFIPTGTTFGTKFGRYGRKTPAPPYPKVRQIGFRAVGEVLRGKTAQREIEQVNAIGGWLRVI
jgi:hypothetical protein